MYFKGGRLIITKSRIVDYILAMFVLIVIPVSGFFLLNTQVNLDPKLYVISSLSGMYFICWSVTIEILFASILMRYKILSSIIFMFLAPILIFYSFNYLGYVSLDIKDFAEAGFSFVFGASVAVGYTLIRPRGKNMEFKIPKMSYKKNRNACFIVSSLPTTYGIYWLLLNQINLGIGYLSLALGAISIGLAFHSLEISEQSDKKMEILEKSNFDRILGLLEERRLNLRGKTISLIKAVDFDVRNHSKLQDKNLIMNIDEYEIYFCFTIWLCLTNLRQIDKIKSRISKDDKLYTMHFVNNLFADLVDGLQFLKMYYNPAYEISGNYPDQIIDISNIGLQFQEICKEKPEQCEQIIVNKNILIGKLKFTPLINIVTEGSKIKTKKRKPSK